ncbi:MAG TPA: biotin--[acetyl-CoA-carboxylase] ligase [Burkholderiales bacterium]|nr:biotin--[acetyl-CoA-carboxylase] ligase [Burkholderiales bacterium]
MRSSSFAILRALAPGGALSVDELAAGAACAVSEVGPAVRDLAAHGIEVRASGAHLRLARPFDVLDAEAIRAGLGPASDRIRVEIVDECDSTNVRAAARAREGAAAGMAIVCELQRAGRGRQGASWFSGLGTSLTFSLVWRFERAAGVLTGLPLVVGVACARALESLGARDVALKWPNDLLLGGAKLGGVLVEAQGDTRGPLTAVIGVGINVRIPDAAAQRAIPQPVADLRAVPYGSRSAALARLLTALDEALTTFGRAGFAAFREEWQWRHAYQGARVRLLAPPGRSIEGVASGVAADGALLLDTGDGVKCFYAGEVSLRPA